MDVATAEVPTIMPVVAFREIHKNAYLKRHWNERRTAFPSRKSEKVWAVFCVHDDSEAFLELYSDQKIALTHKPDWFSSLRTALHISPSICGHDEEFEFAITLPSQVIRLAAPTWEAMMEWVDTIRNKLRELRILAPRENVYSKMPEPKQPLLPTRDPTSPLPLPPAGPSVVVPGVEPRPGRSDSTPHQSNSHHSESSSQRAEVLRESRAKALEAALRVEVRPGVSDTSIVTVNNESSRSSRSHRKKEPQPDEPQTSVIVVTTESPLTTSIQVNPSTSSSSSSTSSSSGESSRSKLTRTVSVPTETAESNVTVIEVPAAPAPDAPSQTDTDADIFLTPPTTPHYEHLYVPDPPEVLRPETRCKLERVSSAGLIPRVPPKHAEQHQTPPKVPNRADLLPRSSSCRGPGDAKVTVCSSQEDSDGTLPSARNTALKVAVAAATTTSLEVKDIPLIGGHQRRRRRSLSTEGTSSGNMSIQPRIGADLIRVNVSAAASGCSIGVAPPVVANEQIPRWTLREQQVAQLRREMMHAAGVRLPLRRKDCVGCIALVDVDDAVWIAGWKQKEHPVLYSALHLGDQLVSVGGLRPQNAAEAQKLLRNALGPHIEIVVNRLPQGNVLALLRNPDGTVGIQLDSGAEIKEVLPDGPAARQGLKSKTPTADGHSLSTWTLTEINGRPLNLFCKEQEVMTRLNSVGKEISILVQPTEFVKLLRKQLKTIKGYKDYLLP